MMTRVKGLILLLVGVVLVMLGLGMWRSPQLNWSGFVREWVLVADAIARLRDNPFALIGILVLVVGCWIGLAGLRRVVRGSR